MRPALFLLLLIPFTARAINQQEVPLTPEQVIQRTNLKRQARNLPALVVNEQLSNAAYAKAQYILQRQYFSHEGWEGFIRQSGYNYCSAGENLGLNHTEAGEVVEAWMLSPSHRANLLKGKYREIGVAVVRGKYKGIDDAVIIVQMFGSRCI
jgi:uncharacterized protein YkwD